MTSNCNRITILTCTYNRAYLLDNLFRSLQKQSNYNFDWLIIDDGSTDNTREKVEYYQSIETNFLIQYIQQKNGGKHRAINRGLQEVLGNYVFIVDSDDELLSDSIATVYQWLENIKDQKNIMGVAGLRATRDGKILGRYPYKKKFKNYVDASNIERYKFHLTGDKAEIYNTEILKRYPFPEFEGEKFISEDVVWR